MDQSIRPNKANSQRLLLICCCIVSCIDVALSAACGCSASQQSLVQMLSSAPTSSRNESTNSSEPTVPTIQIDDMIVPIQDLLKILSSSSFDSKPPSSKSSDFDPLLYINCQRLWPSGKLNYRFSIDFPTTYKNLIRQSLTKLSQITNNLVTFHEAVYFDNIAHVTVVNGAGCSSFVGKMYSYSSQDLSLSVPGCMLESIIQHEFMHALGFFHEQSRSDRDDFVQILWDNIQTAYCSNFRKYSLVIPRGFPAYEYLSIMHYTSDAFTCTTGLSTIVVKPTGNNIRERNNLTGTDVAKLSYIYSASNLQFCSTATSDTMLQCYYSAGSSSKTIISCSTSSCYSYTSGGYSYRGCGTCTTYGTLYSNCISCSRNLCNSGSVAGVNLRMVATAVAVFLLAMLRLV